jgi:hypothetical protein
MINTKHTDGLTRSERLAAEAFDRWPPGRKMVNEHIRQLMAIQESIMPERIQEKTQFHREQDKEDIAALVDLISVLLVNQSVIKMRADKRNHDETRQAFKSVSGMLTDIIDDVIKPAIHELDPQWMEDK